MSALGAGLLAVATVAAAVGAALTPATDRTWSFWVTVERSIIDWIR